MGWARLRIQYTVCLHGRWIQRHTNGWLQTAESRDETPQRTLNVAPSLK